MTTALPTPAAALGAGRLAAVTLVVNGNASSAPSGHRLAELCELLRAAGADVRLEVTHALGELEALWRHDDGRRLVLAGGDGSVHAVANLGGPRREVALIPCGRANNIARSLGIPLERGAAATLAVRGAVRPVDLIDARSRSRRLVVVESVSAGFLAHARIRYHGRNSADLRAGLRAGLGALRDFGPLWACVAEAGAEERLPVSQLFVTNLPLYEFGLRVAPHADPMDRTLDVVLLEARSRAAVLAMLVRLRRGTHLDHRDAHVWRAGRVELSTHGCSPVVGDSTDLGPGPVRLSVLPAALDLVRP